MKTVGAEFSEYARHHPVRLRLPPLHRRGIAGCKGNMFGRIIKIPIDLLAQLAALFCPYGVGEFSEYARHHPVRLRLPPLHRRGIAECKGNMFGRIIKIPIDLLAQSAALFCPYGVGEFSEYARHHPVRLRLPPLHRRGIAGCKGNMFGQIIKIPIDLLAQSAALFCPYGAGKFSEYARHHPVRLRLPPLHRRGIAGCKGNMFGRIIKMPIDLLAQLAALFCPYGAGKFSEYARHHPVRLRRRVQTRCDCSSVSVLVISPPQEGNCRVQRQHVRADNQNAD